MAATDSRSNPCRAGPCLSAPCHASASDSCGGVRQTIAEKNSGEGAIAPEPAGGFAHSGSGGRNSPPATTKLSGPAAIALTVPERYLRPITEASRRSIGIQPRNAAPRLPKDVVEISADDDFAVRLHGKRVDVAVSATLARRPRLQRTDRCHRRIDNGRDSAFRTARPA